MNIPQTNKPIKVDKEFDIFIYQFLNHSSNSMFYGVLAVGLFISTIFLSKALTVTEALPTIAINSIILALAVVVGLLWWRWAVNREDYKMYAQAMLLAQKEDKEYIEKADFIIEVVKSYKKQSIEKFRTIRLYFGLLTSIYFVLTTFAYGNALFDTSINIFDSENILYLIIGGGSLVISVFLSFVIKSQYNKGLMSL